jgi:RNA polymerase sigma-70 factor, ECF subfamily
MMPLTDPRSDASLISRYRAGGRDAATALYRRHVTVVYRFAALWTGSQAAAADVTQEVFIHFFQKPDTFDVTRGALASWLLGIARNTARHHVRDQARWTSIDDEDSRIPLQVNLTTPLDLALRDHDAAQLHTLIRALPPIFRDVIVLIDLQELSYAEAALICDCELGTVRSRLSRARAMLAAAWPREQMSAQHGGPSS